MADRYPRPACRTPHWQVRPAYGNRRRGTWGGMSMVDLAFAPDIEAPAAARAELGNLSLGFDCDEGQAVMLLASELVTNCVRHAGVGRRQRIRLRALVTDNFVRIEVIDSGAGMRVVMRPGDDYGGWGVGVGERSAARWGGGRGARHPRWVDN